ncbi:MAG: MYG1 family protein [Oscillospiraceae bacterium]|nr:MYG1 family protein [Oscillospiraceae bacterium]
MEKINIEAAFTHAGKFHADDVFGTALLRIINPSVEIQRGFTVPQDFNGIVFDIGDGAFDHHSNEKELRENGVPYAAFGLLWRAFGESLVGEEEAARFDEKFVQPLDLNDNTGVYSATAEIINDFNPTWDSDEDEAACFEKAAAFAQIILKNKLESIYSIQRARELVQTAWENSKNGIVILPRFAPWKMVLKHTSADFVIFPSQRGGFGAQSIPVKDAETPLSRYDFPARWAGLRDEALQAESGIETLRFCHASGFLLTGDNVDDLVKACKKARKIQGPAHTLPKIKPTEEQDGN